LATIDLTSYLRYMQVTILRIFRKIHRTLGAFLFLFFFIVAITGLTLGWKKNSNGWILPATMKGSATNLDNWKTTKELLRISDSLLINKVDKSLSTQLDRIDIRKDKGIVKFLYIDNYWEIQLDGQSGNVLQISQRRSDFFEDIHDGSFLDRYFKTDGEPIKLIYTSIMGISLFLFTVTGCWLWLGPKFIRNKKRR
jgi:hypothetical protein